MTATEDDALAGRLILPSAPGAPVTVTTKHPALRMAVVERNAVSHLGENWNAPGVYILLGPVAADGSFEAYVGKAALQSLRQRLTGPDHKKKTFWTRALLTARDATEGFNSAEVGWLEGRLWGLLKNAPAASLVNKPQPKDDTLHPHERQFLEACVAPIAGLLRVLGASPDTLDQLATTPRKKRRRYDETVADLLDAKLLAVGTGLHPIEDKFDTVATVLDDGRLEIDGTVFGAVSDAAANVAGSSRNGWEFWGVASGSGALVTLSDLRARLIGAKESSATGITTTAPPQTAITIPPSTSRVPQLSSAAHEKKSRTSKPKLIRTTEERKTTLKHMIDSGFLTAPVMLRGRYDGSTFTAIVNADGATMFDGTAYDKPSGAARAGKVKMRGKDAPAGVLSTDGWAFWSTQDTSGTWTTLAELRRRYVTEVA